MSPRPYSVEELLVAVNNNDTLGKAAKELRELGRGKVTVQQLRLWLSELDPGDFDGFDRAKLLATTRNARTEANRLRRDVQALTDALGTRSGFLDALERLGEEIAERPPVEFRAFTGGQVGTPMTVELLLSDLQIGKLKIGRAHV